MNTALMTRSSQRGGRIGKRTGQVMTAPPLSRSEPSPRPSARVQFRVASVADAPALHALITAHQEEGHLLPRELAELTIRAPRFIVAVRRGRVVGCAELAPLGGGVAEVRSLVVDRRARALGIGRELVTALQRRARIDGFAKLCAFTHDAGYFVRLGFSIVPHVWVPEKIALDCHSCALFRRCGQHAVVLPLTATTAPRAAATAAVPLVRG
jgi:N-acetylglutamate synthase-like GNAT family acetyltransferase